MVAGVLSGAPSTLHALLSGRAPPAAARAAGNLVLPASAPPRALLLAGTAVHPVVAALPVAPRVADHLVFGALAAAVLDRRRRG